MIFAQCHIAKISFIGSNISFSFWRIYFYKLNLNIWNIWKCCKWNVWMFLIKLEVTEMAQLKMKKKLEKVTLLLSSKLYQTKFWKMILNSFQNTCLNSYQDKYPSWSKSNFLNAISTRSSFSLWFESSSRVSFSSEVRQQSRLCWNRNFLWNNGNLLTTRVL